MVFLFITTGLIYALQVSVNPDIRNYADALYFTVTTPDDHGIWRHNADRHDRAIAFGGRHDCGGDAVFAFGTSAVPATKGEANMHKLRVADPRCGRCTLQTLRPDDVHQDPRPGLADKSPSAFFPACGKPNICGNLPRAESFMICNRFYDPIPETSIA